MDPSKMTKSQLIAELARVRCEAYNARCGCCGMTPREWEETPLLDGPDDDTLTNLDAPVFVPTCWPVANEVDVVDDSEEVDE